MPADLLRRLIQRVHAFVALTDDLAAELRECGARESQIARIPNGISVGRFTPRSREWRRASRAALALPDDRVVAVFAGRFVARKRVKLLVEAVGRLPEAVRPVLLLGYTDDTFGDGTPIDAAVGVHLLPPQQSMPEIYPLADVYLSASTAEGMSNALLEAMACAVPGVVSDIPGHRELVQHGVTGWVFDGPEGLDAILARLVQLRRDGALAAAGLRARQHVCDGYSSTQVAARYRALYQQLFDADRYGHA